MSRVFVAGLLMVAAGLLAGCGPSGPALVVVQGKLVKGGAPLPVPRSDVGLGWVQLQLMPDANAKLEAEQSRTKDDGTFEFVGEGKGVLPGTYRLVVLYYEQGPPNDKLNGAFSKDKTPIRVTIPADKGPTFDLGTIDLDNPPKG